MKTTIARLGLMLPLVATIAACGGGAGGGGGGDGDYNRVSPVAGLSMRTIEDRTGAKPREAKSMSSAVALGVNSSNPAARFLKGLVIFRDSQSLDNGDHADPEVVMNLDTDGNGAIEVGKDLPDQQWSANFNPQSNPIMDATGERLIQKTTIDVGGEATIVTAEVPDFNSMTVLYMPASEASKMYAGMIHHTDTALSQAGGATGIFGIQTTADELAAQIGTASYSGVAIATVSPAGGSMEAAEPGLYSGISTGNVNFTARTMNANATLQREAKFPGRTGYDTITVATSGTVGSDGAISGSAVYGGLALEGNVGGTMKGNLFGPNAETMGLTYIGTDGSSSIAGGMLLNRTDD